MTARANPGRVLVTGAAGFIGANLARRLVADGHDVHLLLGPATSNWRIDGIKADVTSWDLLLEDADAVNRAVRDIRPDRVFHLAAHGAYSSQRSVERMVGTNVAGTVNLVEACLRAGVSSIVNTGSSSEYGYKDHAPREQEWIDPNSHYSWTKAAATMYCRYTSITTGIPITTLRLYSVFGPWEEPTRLMPRLAVLGLDGELPPLVSAKIARDYVHVDDVVDACLAAGGAEGVGGVYNVGTGRQTTLAQLVDIVRAELSIEATPDWGSMPERDWDTDVWVCDPSAIATGLGWYPKSSLEDGFSRFVDWFRRDPTRLELIYRSALLSSS